MIKIAIAGNIASGKSAVEGFFKEKGFDVIDTDKIGHEVLNTHADEIIKAFEGEDILTNGVIDRQKLGAVVFAKLSRAQKTRKYCSSGYPSAFGRIFRGTEW